MLLNFLTGNETGSGKFIFIRNLDGSQTSVISKIIAVALAIVYCVVFIWLSVMLCFYIFLNGRGLTAYEFKEGKTQKHKKNRIGSLNSQEAEVENHDFGRGAKTKLPGNSGEVEQNLDDLESSKLNLIGIHALSADEEGRMRSPPRQRK